MYYNQTLARLDGLDPQRLTKTDRDEWWSLPHLFRDITCARRKRLVYRHLLALPDRLLRDAGLNRKQVIDALEQTPPPGRRQTGG
ncbi:MAG: DUF1127 domain-containing protein [Devosia sp.]